MGQNKIVIAGGGAAGFFAAIASARAEGDREVALLERSSHCLTKVRISGGGRCNVTHVWSGPRTFAEQYPRGRRELISPLHRFSADATVAWFEKHGVPLKQEADGRMFPTTDSSETVVDCLLTEAKSAGVKILTRTGLESVNKRPDRGFDLTISGGEAMICDRLLLATGGARDGAGALAKSLGHTIEAPVPSLFSFHVAAPWLRQLPGVSVGDAELTVPEIKLRERGPLLITHNGVSGPGVLRLSAWGARVLHEMNYRFELCINWIPEMTEASLRDVFQQRRRTQPNRSVINSPIGSIPARLWEKLVLNAKIAPTAIWTSLTRAGANALLRQLRATKFEVNGKSLNKEEFVTCGGVRLREIDFKTMESRIVPHLYFAGELLDIDGITGGFNFQAAWATGWIAGHAMADAEAISPI